MTRFSVKLSNILGLSFYRYELTSSNYNPQIDSSITLTVKVTDVFGNAVNNKTVQLYLNGTSLGSSYQLTTNSSGIATATYTCTDWGIQDFSVSNVHCQVNVNSWKSITLTNGTLYVNGETRVCELHYSKTNVAFTSADTWTFVETVSQIANYPPVDNNNYYISANPNILTRVYATGSIQARNTTTGNSFTVQFNAMWHY